MLSQKIKAETKATHLQLEKVMLQQIRLISSKADYADFLSHFSGFYAAAESRIRNQFLKTDLTFPSYRAPALRKELAEMHQFSSEQADCGYIDSLLSAIGAYYVLAGSIHGAPHIRQMIEKQIEPNEMPGFLFFSPENQAQNQWGAFINFLNELVLQPFEEAEIQASAHRTFKEFETWISLKDNVKKAI